MFFLFIFQQNFCKRVTCLKTIAQLKFYTAWSADVLRIGTAEQDDLGAEAGRALIGQVFSQ